MTYPVLRIERSENAELKAARLRDAFKAQERSREQQPCEREILLKAGLPPARLARIEALAVRWGVPVREAALSIGAVRPQGYVRAVAAVCGLDSGQVRNKPHLRSLSPLPEPHELLGSARPAPLLLPQGGVVLDAETCPPEAVAEAVSALGPERGRLFLATRADMTASLAKAYAKGLAARASDGLWQRNPRLSAATGLIGWQAICLALFCGLFLGAVAFAPRGTFLVYGAALSLMFTIAVSLRGAAALFAIHRRVIVKPVAHPPLPDSELPRYTVLVALYRESRVLPQLVSALKALDYPPAKLDIKLILEVSDHETVTCARGMELPTQFEIVIVPEGKPRTKPRALNYALQFARGELLVIYDAEDRPDPDQLRKAAAHFAAAEPEVVCLQGQLTFENVTENWLSRQFSIEYACLFAGFLPVLDRLRLPIPLGGTSNHFRIKTLRKLGGWDAYNVTEDADLGMRIYRAGLRAEVLYSQTLEEAACQPGNWLRQRTRWLKGWMQTYIVHMRQPARLARELGLPGFIAFQGHFAGIILAALVFPLSCVIIAHDVTAGIMLEQPVTLIGRHLLSIAIFNLVVGFAVSFALGLSVLARGQVGSLLPHIPFIPFYWLFISFAAYRALYQLFADPHFWEKTEHFGASANAGNAGA